LLASLVLLPPGCHGSAFSVETPANTRSSVTESAAWRTAITESGALQVAWRPSVDPLPRNEPFELEVVVRCAGSAELVTDAEVHVSGWMPAHRHGMLRRPQTKALKNGNYQVRGLLLHMEGDWQLLVHVARAGTFDRARFDLRLTAPLPLSHLLKVLNRGPVQFDQQELSRILELSPVGSPRVDPSNAFEIDPAAAHLGQYLFYEPALSGSGTISCASCHLPEKDWSDGRPLPQGLLAGRRHTPSLWNVAQQRWFFWDGRADSLWSQALGPLEDPAEHGGNRLAYAHWLASSPALERGYHEAFGPLPNLQNAGRFPPAGKPMPGQPSDPLAQAWDSMDFADQRVVNRVFANLGKALAAFQRKILSGDAPLDQLVQGLRRGKEAVHRTLSEGALRGLKIFVGKGQCFLCHHGPLLSDREFHNNRLPTPGSLDLGRAGGIRALLADPFRSSGEYSDAGSAPWSHNKLDYLVISGESRGEFRTPSLRNVARTAPYMHRGQIGSLEEVVEFYSSGVPPLPLVAHGERILEPKHFTAEEKSDLVEFLHALSGTPAVAGLRRQPETPYLKVAPRAGNRSQVPRLRVR
jgi:cytochrome c peroxidase